MTHKKKVLVVAAHPDDEILGCGGTMALHVDKGNDVYVVFMADGVASRGDSKNLLGKINERKQSAIEACAIIGCKHPVFLGFPDNQLDACSILDITQKLESVIDEINPEIVYTHHNKDLNVDHIKVTIKPSVFRQIRRKCFVRQGEPNWAEHCAMFSSVVNTALIYEVPLVVWGEDIAFEFGGQQRSDSSPTAIEIDKSDLTKEKTIFDWLDDDVSERDIFFYKYPDYEKLKSAGVKSIYLGHFLKWYGRQNYEFVKKRGFVGRKLGPLPGNYLDYDNIDEKLCEINIWFKYLKFGFWRPTDQTCYDIWNDKLDREDAVTIVKSLQDQKPFNDLEDFLLFHMLTMDEFNEVVERFRNKDIWSYESGEWQLNTTLI